MDKEYVMRGNAAILKCSIPSFVADFVHVVAWVDEESTEIVASEDFNASKTDINRIRDTPSFFIIISFHMNFVLLLCSIVVVNQFYTPGLIDNEYVMRGNAAILKCIIPSFVSDFVHVVAWMDEKGTEIVTSTTNFFESRIN